ncbi:MAG: hypothetical protein KY393_02845 [Actinobacteria bacterium]|nr:hypothetical protein [Actinomycetota bacterium]
MIKRVLIVALLVLGAGCTSAGNEAPEAAEGSPTPSPTEAATEGDGQLRVTVDSSEAESIIEHFKAEGLPVGDYQTFTGDSSPFTAVGDRHLYTDLAVFHDERVGDGPVILDDTDVIKFDESGGAIELFENREDLNARLQQIEGVRGLLAARGGELEPEFQIRQGNILLRLGHVMEEWAGEYEAALASYPG